MAERKRFSRKELKQPDEFLTTSEKLLALLKANQGLTFSIAIGVIMIGGSSVFFLKNRQVQAMRMESVLYEMSQVLSRGGGAESLKKYLDSFKEGNQKTRAKMILADAYFQEKKIKDSIKLYQEVLQTSHTGNLINDLAQLSLGYSYEQDKNFQKAIKTYKALIDGNGSFALFNVYFSLVRVYQKEKDYNNAILILRKMQNQFSDHVYFEQVLEKIKTLEKLA